VLCQGSGIDRSPPPILVLGLAQADLHLISDEYYLYLSGWFILIVVKLVEVLLLIFIVVIYRSMGCSRPVGLFFYL
jgi:hypothetical protein